MDTNTLSERFRIFAERECKGSSLLYEHLAENIAADTTLLQLAAQSCAGQPVPNLLLGADALIYVGLKIDPELHRNKS